MIFDTHAHLVCSDRDAYPPKPLRGELTPGEFDDPVTVEKLISAMAENDVARACAVQRAHVYGYDNSYMLDSVARFAHLLRAVVVLDPQDAATPENIRQHARDHAIAGVRFGARDLAGGDLGWLTSDASALAWRAAADLGLPICIHVLHVQRDAVLPALAARLGYFADATVVIDHVGGAHAARVEQAWLAAQGRAPGEEMPDSLLRLADHANAIVKLSEINLDGSPDPAAFVSRVVSLFGESRVIWGSDIGQSRADYGHMVAQARESVSHLTQTQQDMLLRGNATRIYG